MAVEFGSTTARSTYRKIGDASESWAVGKELASELNEPGLRHGLVFSDGLGSKW
jgi:hypothetical protein